MKYINVLLTSACHTLIGGVEFSLRLWDLWLLTVQKSGTRFSGTYSMSVSLPYLTA
jgi:hypothetical protein